MKKRTRATLLTAARRIGLVFLIILVIGVAFGALTTPPVKPLAAIGVMSCGLPQGTVVVFSDGKAIFFRPGDPRLPPLIESIPKSSLGTMTTAAKLCAQTY